MSSSAISIRQLAKELGLNSSTVSRALNRHPAIHPDTIARVEAAAKKYGYRPNPDIKMAMAAVRRATRESLYGILGVLNFYPDDDRHQHELHAGNLYQGILSRAEHLGWKLDEILVFASGMTDRRVRSILQARNIAGVLLLPPPLNRVECPIDLSDFQVVLTSAAWTKVPALEMNPAVLPAHWRNAYNMFDYVRKQGYRRPLLHIHQGIELRHMRATEAAFLLSQYLGYWEANLPIHHGRLEARSFRKILDKHRPDVIIGPDLFVKEFLERDLGLQIPKDVAFIAYSRKHPGIACFDECWHAIGEFAVDMLVSLIMHRERDSIPVSRNLLVIGRVVPGPTLPARDAV